MQNPGKNAKPVTQVLARLARGDAGAASDLLPLVYDELIELARARMARMAPGQTLQATALVHEAWLRLGGDEPASWDNRAHFFGAAARAMRNILVDQARRPHKRSPRPELPTEIPVATAGHTVDLIALDDALTRLEQQHGRPARVVMLRYFAGLSIEQIAELLDVSPRTVDREWLFARTWLQRALEGGADGP